MLRQQFRIKIQTVFTFLSLVAPVNQMADLIFGRSPVILARELRDSGDCVVIRFPVFGMNISSSHDSLLTPALVEVFNKGGYTDLIG